MRTNEQNFAPTEIRDEELLQVVGGCKKGKKGKKAKKGKNGKKA